MMGTITCRLQQIVAVARSVWVTLAVCVAAVLSSLWETGERALEFDRHSVFVDHEYWRLITGHLTHFNLEHFFLDALMFVILGGICERKCRGLFVWCLIASMVAISTTIVWASPGTSRYRGLSGVDSAIFALAAGTLLIEARRRRDRVATWGIVCVFAGFIAKVGYEVVTDATLFVNSEAAGFVPIPLAHAVGAMVGVSIVGASVALAAPLAHLRTAGGSLRSTPATRRQAQTDLQFHAVTLSRRQASS
jgi:rhomboid family GlyGly-CTERM serine protease